MPGFLTSASGTFDGRTRERDLGNQLADNMTENVAQKKKISFFAIIVMQRTGTSA
jgi:hypothetical protein